MGVGKEKKFIETAVYMAQDNIFLRQMVTEMVRFITEAGILAFSTDKRQQEYMVRNYFRSISLDAIERKGFNMGIGTPWGKEVMELVKNSGIESSEEEECDIEDEQED